ncbi:BCCT family transporter [Vallitalea okinawensis]|uniref:BCCT family transporter n=1 Tax=Vallitalea okinawensis TaxID=2078660 RepID=UPI000CFD8E66|nr:BCCT family transporter [Vallitalea okinawensis]
MLKRIEKGIMIPSILIVLGISFGIIINPETSKRIITQTQEIITNQYGYIYIWYGIFAFVFVIGISFSKYGRVRLGSKEEGPEFKTFSWAAMLFCAGIGASVIYWGVIEWAYYYIALPYGGKIESFQAAELAATYGIFHWGPVAWSIYAVSSASIGYLYHVRKVPVLRISEACRPILKEKVDGILGKGIDVLFILGLLGGAGTSLGLGTPLATEGIARIFNIEITIFLEIAVLLIITLLFAVSAYSGLKKGIKILSNINIILTIFLLLFVFVVGDTIFMINMGTSSIGVLIDKFPIMMTWLDPVGKSGFPQDWTVFYWAWWVAYAPFMGMFIARISKGRTVKNMLLGSITFGSIGCAVFFIILGNYGLNLQLSGSYNVIDSLSNFGGAVTIINILETMPVSKVIILLVTIVSIVFMATTFDSASYVMAVTVHKKQVENYEPDRWIRVFWALTLGVVPISFILLESELSILQTASIVAALPVTLIGVLTAWAYIKMVNEDR